MSSREEGYVAAWVAFLATTLFVLGGLVYDAADRGAEARRATMVANEAARAAAQALSTDAIVGQEADLDPARGADAARTYLANQGVSGSVTISGDQVNITTRLPWSPTFSPLGGGEVTGTAAASTNRT